MALTELSIDDVAGLASSRDKWASRGIQTESRTLGDEYRVAGKVIERRRIALEAKGVEGDSAVMLQAHILSTYSERTTLQDVLKTSATALFEVRNESGELVATGENWVELEALNGTPLLAFQVEHHVGLPQHGFEDRRYHGILRIIPDRTGKLALTNVLHLEDLLKGLVPSEIFSTAPAEALKAQAVAARGNIVAKIGHKHRADGYQLCSEVHCAVYSGLTSEAATTNAAVEVTRGEILLSASGRLIEGVFSAVCGGHSEHNEMVWAAAPDPNLRGRPDLLPNTPAQPGPSQIAAYVATGYKSACGSSTFITQARYRWEKRMTAAELNTATSSLNIGPIQSITVEERGVSGRAKVVALLGDLGTTRLYGESSVRKQFGSLNSAVVAIEMEPGPDGRPLNWLFRGAGWGHGVGMCQQGAIGRAEAGQTYHQILDHYFSNPTIEKLY
ncbi:MAG: SpoIID/LytB domain-containing protein [Myxococcaceae bacterium]